MIKTLISSENIANIVMDGLSSKTRKSLAI